MKSKQVLYIHGGPGLNSHPEEQLLKSKFKENNYEVIFWNEPKKFQSDNYYLEIVKSISDQIEDLDNLIILAHSFGARMTMDALNNISNKSKIQGLVFLAPCVNMIEVDQDIIDYSLTILQENNSQNYQLLKNLLPLNNHGFDENRKNALLLAFSSNYMIKNFNTIESFQNFFQHLSGENEFRLNDYLKIRESIPDYFEIKIKFSLPLMTIYGQNDPIIKPIKSDQVLDNYFENNQSVVIKSTSHYPHIDNFIEFLEFFNKLDR